MTEHTFALTKHAIERALDMALDPDEVRRAVENPTRTEDGRDGRELRTAGRITVVFNADTRVVITILWRYEATRKTDVRRADHYGREDEWADHSRMRADMRRTKTRTGKAFDGRRSNRRSGSRKKFKEEW